MSVQDDYTENNKSLLQFKVFILNEK